MNVTLRQLRAFAAVARHKSFTRAAEELHLTQPAISMQVKQLEAQLGLPLFEQAGRALRLNEAGEEVYRQARALTQQLDELEEVLDRLKGLERGRLTISAISTATYFVPRLLGTFSRRYPGITVSLDVTNREEALAHLRDNEVDMAIMGQPPAGLELEAGPFMENPLVIAAAPDHPLAGVSAISHKRLEDEVFLVREPGSGTRSAMERFFRDHRLKLRTGMEMKSLEAIKQSVQAGLGLGLLPRDAIEMELAQGRLVALEVVGFPILRHWYVVHRKGKSLPPAANAFRGFLLTEAAGLLGKASVGAPPISEIS
ncbi:MAG: LysR substrate-binding domain-containing protein [Magnetospirillum sp. WYHS-4]